MNLASESRKDQEGLPVETDHRLRGAIPGAHRRSRASFPSHPYFQQDLMFVSLRDTTGRSRLAALRRCCCDESR
jgi:hypothetical protein